MALHRNPKYWERPNDFHPWRFLKPYNKDAFIPFSDGARSCIGKKFALIEATRILTILCQKYKIELANEMDREKILEAKLRITLSPKNQIFLKFIER